MQPVGLLVEDRRDRPDRPLPLVVGDLEHRALRRLEQLAGRSLAVVHARLDLVCRLQQRPHLRLLADDPAVFRGVAAGGHPGGQLFDRLRPADLVQPVVQLQALGDRQMVDLPVGVVEVEHRLEDRGVLRLVEVLRAQLLVDEQRVQMALVEEHRPQHRLLGGEVVGRKRGGCGGGRGDAHGRDRL